ncbi:MAG TPA: SulP family inorganic anion transporter [Burkholderiales bacterium]
MSLGSSQRVSGVRSGGWRKRFPHLAGDFRGGLASSIVGLPYAVTAAMLAFAPLGPDYVGHGMLAGLVTALVAGLVTINGTPCQISGPRGSVSVLTAGIVALALAHPALSDAGAALGPRVLGVLLLCLMMAGAIQVVFGVLGMGSALRFLPYPVISGFMVALGILVALPQVPTLLGTPGPGDWWSALHQLPAMRPGALFVGLATIATLVQVRKRLPKWPAPAVAILAGTLAHYTLAFFSSFRVGPVPWDLVNGSFPPLPWEVPKVVLDRPTFSVLIDLLPATLTLAFVGSLESLLSSSVLAITSNMRYDSRRELVGQGIANIAIAAAGGVASAAAPFRGVTNYNAGGRTRLSGVVNGLMIGGIGLAAAPLLFWMPLAAWAGVLAVVGLDVASAWARRLAGNPRADVAIGVLVMLVTLVLGTAPAILVGIAGMVFLYVHNTSRVPIRGTYDGTARAALRVRPEAQRVFLQEHGLQLLVVELEGAVFFGTADRCGREIEQRAGGRKHLIVDMSRVSEIDTTGAFVLMQTFARLRDEGTRVALAEVRPGGRRGRVLRLAGVTRVVPEHAWFADLDAALEDAEDRILERHWPERRDADELPLAQMELCSGMSPDETAALAGFLRREAYPAGAVLFTEGTAPGAMYLLARGAVTLRIHLANPARTRRLSTYSPGLAFGEMAVLQNRPRSAEAVCEGPTVLYALNRPMLERMAREAPSLHAKLLFNLALHMATRLRATTLQLRAALE